MFIHQFKYTIKCFMRQKISMFWTLAFPIILVTFYNIAFAGILDTETIQDVNMGIVKGQYVDDSFQEAARESGMFKITTITEEEAKKKLEDGSLDLYVIDVDAGKVDAGVENGRDAQPGDIAGKIRLVTGGNGVGQSIAKLFTDAYIQISLAAGEIGNEVREKVVETGNMQLMDQVFGKLKDTNAIASNVKNEPLGDSTNPLVIFYYGAIAMSTLFGSFSGVGAVANCQANQSVIAGRVNVSPVRKMTAFFVSCIANYLIQLTSITLMLLYIKFVIKLDIGSNFPMIMLVAAVGVLTGICMGAMVGVLIKKGLGVKETILQVVCIFGGFLAGMMSMDIKYYIHQQLPLVEKINPASLISDSLYTMYYYGTYDKVFENISILLLEAAIFAATTIWVLRRNRYASI